MLLLLLLRCRGLGAGHLRGCWICCVLGETCLSMEACGFWWATCAAAGGKSLSPRAITPEMYTVGLGGLVLSHSWSSLSFFSFPSPVCGCFCTIRIPATFTETQIEVGVTMVEMHLPVDQWSAAVLTGLQEQGQSLRWAGGVM